MDRSRFHDKPGGKFKVQHKHSAEMSGQVKKRTINQDTEDTHQDIHSLKHNQYTEGTKHRKLAIQGVHNTAKNCKVTPHTKLHRHHSNDSGSASYSARLTDKRSKHGNKEITSKHKTSAPKAKSTIQQHVMKGGDMDRTLNEESSDDGGEDVEADSDAEEGESDEDEYAAIKKELANIPLEDLVKIKEKVGLKAFSKILHGEKSREKVKTDFKRANKNRPMEMSSKRPVPIVNQAAVPKKKVSRDPRFDDLSGEYKEEHFTRNYSFISDVKAKEKQLLEKQLKKCKNETKEKQLRFLLNRISQQEQSAKQKEQQQEVESTWKQKERELVQEGKTPYFLKKADKRKLELASKFRDLDKSGKVDNYLSKKRKKSAQKQRKKLPGRPDIAV